MWQKKAIELNDEQDKEMNQTLNLRDSIPISRREQVRDTTTDPVIRWKLRPNSIRKNTLDIFKPLVPPNKLYNV